MTGHTKLRRHQGLINTKYLLNRGFQIFTSLNAWHYAFCRLFLGSDIVTSSAPTKEQPKSATSGSSGESMDSVSVSSCESNHSEVEEGSITPMDTPDEPQKKVHP